jgi:enoyl-CoA hydratase/3-hydroxyacyl-CoA dehydrogenase
MAFTFRGRTLSRIGVIGSGQIGPDIALFFAKTLAAQGVSIAVVDISPEALAKGRAKFEKKVSKGVESGAFKPAEAAAMNAAMLWTSEYAELASAGLVIEAATESAAIKAKIFQQLEAVCAADTILASNSSHLEPEVIASSLKDRSRSLVVHYFFPAERNYMVEVVPGADTTPALAQWVRDFYERIGKVPVIVKSRYGYAVDPVFEGLFLAAALCVEAGLGTVKEVDTVAARALGLGVGPFTAMNLTGGNAITGPGLAQEGEKIMPWFRTPEILKTALANKSAWEVAARGEKVDVPAERASVITERMQGAFLGLCDEILSAGLINLADFEMAIEMGLVMKGPARLANELGVQRALELARGYAAANAGFREPRWLAECARAGGSIDVPVVLRRDEDGIAILTIRRPGSLNSLNEAAFQQLGAHFRALRDERAIKAVVLTGFGTKAFVSGADVKFLARATTPEAGMKDSRDAQALTLQMESLGKPIVCAMNGLAFGGGLEIAMAATVRVAVSGLKVLCGQPEAKLGIIPGAGGTQRLPRLIGLTRAAVFLRTGRTITSLEAKEFGLVSELMDVDALVPRAVALARGLADGSIKHAGIQKGPLLDVPEELPAIDIGHLSRAVDAILCRAILEGARTTLVDGLTLENLRFGDVCRTADMKIGIENFLKNGPRAEAQFTHA